MRRQLHERYRSWIEPLQKLEGCNWALVSLFSVLYFGGSLLLASKKLMWNDELFTYYIARLPHLSDAWKALATGAEQTPPLFYMITRTAFALFGVSPVSIRLPEILAFWVMCVCLFYFVAKRSSPLFGLVAMVFPLVTGAHYYATEARAYALVLGFSALGLLCWRWAIEGPRRRLALAGLTLSVAAAISSHYYAVLVLVPLGLGELVRSIKGRRIDVAVWAALGLSLSPLLLFLPLIESARTYAPTFWAKPEWLSMLFFYHRFLLPPTALPIMVMLLLVMFYAASRPPECDLHGAAARFRIPAHEVAAAIGFMLIPVVGIILAKTVVGAFNDRYALPAVIGLSIMVAWGLDCAFAGHSVMALAVGLFLCGMLVAKEVQSYKGVAQDREDRVATYALLEKYATRDVPIVLANPGMFIELSHHPPGDIANRLLYLTDSHLALEDTGTDDVEKGVVEMKRWARVNVQPYQKLLVSAGEIFILTQDYPDRYEWLIPELRKAHWKIDLLAWQAGNILLVAKPAHK